MSQSFDTADVVDTLRKAGVANPSPQEVKLAMELADFIRGTAEASDCRLHNESTPDEVLAHIRELREQRDSLQAEQAVLFEDLNRIQAEFNELLEAMAAFGKNLP